MNLYKISVKECGYDEYDSWIVAAESEEDIHREDRESEYGLQLPINLYKWDFSEDFRGVSKLVKKQKLNIKKIGETDLYDKFTYILGSFNAG